MKAFYHLVKLLPKIVLFRGANRFSRHACTSSCRIQPSPTFACDQASGHAFGQGYGNQCDIMGQDLGVTGIRNT